jgi:high-affinity iron transporter
MFSTGLIVFRETLEAALFVGILAAATRGLERRGLWLAGGVMAGLAGSLAMAACMERISTWADGVGADLLNVGIISIALAMLTWHCVWMSIHGREMAMDARRLGSSAVQGDASLWAIAVAVALSVLREGAETVLFVAGFMSGSHDSSGMVLSAAVGLGAGAVVGAMLYLGLARIRPQHLFSVTNVLIWMLAGSLASQLARSLSQAGLVEGWSDAIWDTSALLSNDDSLGILFHALAGYDATPTGLQVLFYVGAIGLITVTTTRIKAKHGPRQAAVAKASA